MKHWHDNKETRYEKSQSTLNDSGRWMKPISLTILLSSWNQPALGQTSHDFWLCEIINSSYFNTKIQKKFYAENILIDSKPKASDSSASIREQSNFANEETI